MSEPDARQRIFESAVEEFSQKGRSGARVDVIVSNAGVNKQLLYYYFGSKERLFREAVAWSVSELLGSIDARSVDPLALSSLLLEYHFDRPEVLRLILWEALDPVSATGGELSDDPRRSGFLDVVDRFKGAQKLGAVRDDVDAETLVFVVIAVVGWAAALRTHRDHLLGGLSDREVTVAVGDVLTVLLSR